MLEKLNPQMISSLLHCAATNYNYHYLLHKDGMKLITIYDFFIRIRNKLETYSLNHGIKMDGISNFIMDSIFIALVKKCSLSNHFSRITFYVIHNEA